MNMVLLPAWVSGRSMNSPWVVQKFSTPNQGELRVRAKTHTHTQCTLESPAWCHAMRHMLALATHRRRLERRSAWRNACTMMRSSEQPAMGLLCTASVPRCNISVKSLYLQRVATTTHADQRAHTQINKLNNNSSMREVQDQCALRSTSGCCDVQRTLCTQTWCLCWGKTCPSGLESGGGWRTQRWMRRRQPWQAPTCCVSVEVAVADRAHCASTGNHQATTPHTTQSRTRQGDSQLAHHMNEEHCDTTTKKPDTMPSRTARRPPTLTSHSTYGKPVKMPAVATSVTAAVAMVCVKFTVIASGDARIQRRRTGKPRDLNSCAPKLSMRITNVLVPAPAAAAAAAVASEGPPAPPATRLVPSFVAVRDGCPHRCAPTGCGWRLPVRAVHSVCGL